MEERNYGINWLGLFIKVIVFVVVVLLAIWLISKIVSKDKGLTFEENNQLFQEATVEYFKKNLPKNEKTSTVTLKQLISWDYIEKLKDQNGKKCNYEKSTSKIEETEDYYTIKTVLVCGDKSETSYIKLGNEECSICDIKVDGLKIPKKEEQEQKEEEKEIEKVDNNTEISKGGSIINTTQNQQNNNNPTTQNQMVLYEYVKETLEYSDWYVGKVTGSNIENSTRNESYSKYCKNEKYTYYTVSYTLTSPNTYKYTLKLNNTEGLKSIKLDDVDYFTNYSDYQNYVKNKYKDIEMVGGANHSLPSASNIKNSALTKKNFSYTVSNVYEKSGEHYIDIKITVYNLNGVTPYYESKIKSKIYFVPLKFTTKYTNYENCITDKTENSSKYTGYTVVDTWNEKIDIYRYKHTIKEYVWSNQTYLEGYTKTGKTKLAD